MRRDREVSADPAKFWAKVDRSGDCWLWIPSAKTGGYGFFSSRPTLSAHRVAWALTHGRIPDGLCVLHKCDNPSCVRPDHLFLGTNADNTHDALAKGRIRHPHNNQYPRDLTPTITIRRNGKFVEMRNPWLKRFGYDRLPKP